jgi:hypothetical protein
MGRLKKCFWSELIIAYYRQDIIEEVMLILVSDNERVNPCCIVCPAPILLHLSYNALFAN